MALFLSPETGTDAGDDSELGENVNGEDIIGINSFTFLDQTRLVMTSFQDCAR